MLQVKVQGSGNPPLGHAPTCVGVAGGVWIPIENPLGILAPTPPTRTLPPIAPR